MTRTQSTKRTSRMKVDRISFLPDNLLHHILSFLDTQEVIKTTYILSKRWTNLWTSIPTLTFNYPSFSCSCHLDSRERCFRRFIKRVLSHRRMHITPLSKVKKLSLCFISEPFGRRHRYEELLDRKRFENGDRMVSKLLFYFAALNDVEELSINGGAVDLSSWCRHFSTCRSLKLSGYLQTKWVPQSLKFLKSLEIENFFSNSYFEGDMFLPTYPVLERLVLRGSCFERAMIFAPKLKYLEMKSISVMEDRFTTEILLFAPKLTDIKLYDVVPSLVSIDEFFSLQNVEFSMCLNVSIIHNKMKQRVVGRLRDFLKLLQNANSLTFNSLALEVLEEFINPSQMEDEAFMFQKLKHLRLKGSITMSNHFLSSLLNSPSLEEWNVEEYW